MQEKREVNDKKQQLIGRSHVADVAVSSQVSDNGIIA